MKKLTLKDIKLEDIKKLQKIILKENGVNLFFEIYSQSQKELIELLGKRLIISDLFKFYIAGKYKVDQEEVKNYWEEIKFETANLDSPVEILKARVSLLEQRFAH